LEGLVPFTITESDWKATNTLSTPTISPNISNQNFEIAILFNVVERSRNYVFEGDTSPTVKKRLSRLEIEGLVPFLIVENDWRAISLPFPRTH
jgi:hypothetical protein